MKTVSDLTKFDWEEVYRMPACEFFAYIDYAVFRYRRDERERKKFERRRKR